MKTSEVFILRKCDVPKVSEFHARRKKRIFKLGEEVIIVKHEDIINSDLLYFYVTIVDNKIANSVLSTEPRWEFHLCPKYEFVDFYRNNRKVNFNPESQEEEREMLLENMKIEQVVIGKVEGMALKVALQKLIKDGDLPDASIEKEDGKAYLVKDGSVIDLTGEDFANKVKQYLEGRTINSLQSNKLIYKIATTLGMVESITLTKAKNTLDDILG